MHNPVKVIWKATHVSKPGFIRTAKTPMTGRWSETLSSEMASYLRHVETGSPFFSVRHLHRIRSVYAGARFFAEESNVSLPISYLYVGLDFKKAVPHYINHSTCAKASELS
jgi:hypothetical protein